MKKKNIVISTLLFTVLGINSIVAQPAYAFGPRVFAVTRVAPWDKLNVREEPGISSEIVGRIPANGEDIVVIGKKETVGKATWANVAWGPIKGWVNERYLTAAYTDDAKQDKPQYRSRVGRSKTTEAFEATLECGGVKPFWNIDLNKDSLQVNIKDDHYDLPIYSRRTSFQYKESTIIKGKESGDTAKLYLSKDYSCKDGITDISYPYTVKAIINGKASYSGCCSIVEN